MKRLILFIICANILVLVSCKKDDSGPDPVPSANDSYGTLTYLENLDISSLPCDLSIFALYNTNHIYIQDICYHIIRFDKTLAAVDWIGFDKNGDFGIHPLNDLPASGTSEMQFIRVNNSDLIFMTRDLNANKIYQRFNLTSSTIDTIPYPIELYFGRIFLSNGKVVTYNTKTSKIERYNEDGSFDINYDRTQAVSFADNYLKCNGSDNVWLLDNVQNFNEGPKLLKYGPDGKLTNTYETDFMESYLPTMAISEDDLIYIEVWLTGKAPVNYSDIKSYNTKGELVAEYRGPDNVRSWLGVVVQDKSLYYNGSMGEYEIWQFKVK